MPITPAQVRQGFKRYGARAWVDGQAVTLTELPTRTISVLRGRSTCAVKIQGLPPGGGKAAAVDLVLDGGGVTRFFTGLTAERGAVAASMDRTVNIVDILDLDKANPATITWSGTSFADAVTDVLEAAGLTASEIDSIFDPGADYELGSVYDIEIGVAENLRAVFQELMEFGGTAAIVTPSGRVRVVDNPGIPAATASTVYAAISSGSYGADDFKIFDAGVQIEGDEGVVSVFTATGPRTPSGAQPDGTFTATGITGRAEARQYRFAQSDATCQAIAERELRRRARSRVNVYFTAPLNPNLLPGDTILLRVDRIGLTSNTPAYVMEVATDAEAGMRVVVSLNPSLIDGYATSTPPPVADFSMLVESQLVTLAGVPTTSFLVQCRDESRDPTGAEITTRSWTASGTGAAPTSSSDAAPIFLFTDLTGAEISLTVESETGEQATVTRTPEANTAQVLTRVVSVAAGSDGWRVLATTAGWRTFTGAGANCTAVPSFNESGPLWAGFANGRIYSSADALASAPVLSTTLPDSIGAIYVNEGDISNILAGSGGVLYRSTNGGASWVAVHDFEATITDCQSSPDNPDEIRVTAGESMWLSYDGGASWTAVATEAGATAEALATAPWGRAAVFSNGAVVFEEGYTVNWAGTPPAALSAITPLLTSSGFIVGNCNDLVRDGALDSLALTAGTGDLYLLTWNGTSYDGEALTPTATGGAGKLVAQAAAYEIDSSTGLSIGYGPLGIPRSPVEILILTNGANPGGVWHWANGVWTLRNAGLPSGWNWDHIAVNPLNPNDWLLIGSNGSMGRTGGNVTSGGSPILYRTTDAGLTWTAVNLPDDGTPTEAYDPTNAANNQPIGYLSNGDLFVFGNYGSGVTSTIVLWRGPAGSMARTLLTTTGGGRGAHSGVGGNDGDIIVTFRTGGDDVAGYLASGATTLPSSIGMAESGARIVRSNLGRGALYKVGTFIGRTDDYRAGPITSATLTGDHIAMVGDYALVAGGRTGVYRVSDPASSLTTGAIVAADLLTTEAIASDHARTRAAAIVGDATAITLYYTTDGETWGTVAGPPGGSLRVDTLAVISSRSP